MKRTVFISIFSSLIIIMLSICVTAQTPEFSTVRFEDSDGNAVTSYPASGTSVYVKMPIINNTGGETQIILLAGCYDENGVLIKLFSDKRIFLTDEADTMSLRIDITEENLNIIANAFMYNERLIPCIKNATMLKDSTDISFIKINGHKLLDYTNEKDSYNITVNTPEADVVAAATDSTTDIHIKKIHLPGVIKVDITSQFGQTRTVMIDCDTTNETERPIINEHLILNVYAQDNTGRNIMDKSAKTWADLSGYQNDITLNEDSVWTDKGFSAISSTGRIPVTLPQIICDAVNSYNFSLQFELADLSAISDKKCPIISSPNENFVIYVEKDSQQAYFKFGGAIINSWKPNVTKEQMLNGVNTIVVDAEVGTMSWYVDGSLISEKDIRNSDVLADSIILSDFNDGYGGTAIFKSISVYDRALSVQEIEVPNE